MDNNTALTIMPGTILKVSNGVQIWIKGDSIMQLARLIIELNL